MIELSRLNGNKFYLNPELLESIEATPDTTLRLINGKTYMVQEPVKQVRALFMQYQRTVRRGEAVGKVPPGWNVIETGSESK
jgi:flagellar protein FlbD